MKRYWLTGLLLATICPLIFAEAPRGSAAKIEIEPGNGIRPHAAVMSEMNAFVKLDRDKDGWLFRDELDPDFCAQFDVIDGSADGLISPKEYEIHAGRRSLMADIVNALMIRSDKDRDGLLARSEFVGRPAAFVWADRDENNFLHHEEIMLLVGSAQTFQYDVPTYFKAHDLDSDGAVSIDEWNKVEKDEDLFRAIDFDQNMVLMPDETFWFLYRYERRLEPAGRTEPTRIMEEKDSDRGQG